ncbi:UNVERIFIED_CONTAM: Protein kinase [Siphonaria sp. JEL0065]|nr:Protein kinase [Siphonaria sp. JEL0065]
MLEKLHLRHTGASLASVLPRFNTNRKTPDGSAPEEAKANEEPAQLFLKTLLGQLSPSPAPENVAASNERDLELLDSLQKRQSSFKLEKKKSGVDLLDLNASSQQAQQAHENNCVLEGVAQVCDPEEEIPDQKPANLKEEAVLGDYLLQKTIGEGCFSKVKMAIHFPSGHKVAIKCMDKNLMKAEIGTSERTLREILVLSHLFHPNITRLLEVVDTKDYLYLILEYEEGGELFDYIVSKTVLPEQEARTMFRQLLSAIQYCHINGIVHRDLKPENILLDKNGSMKLIDFGFSNVIREGDQMDTFCGSPSYAAPEMIARRKYNGQDVDIWALGVILFVLVCGYHPFDHKHMGRMYSNILAARFKFPEDEKLHISDEVKDIITSMLKVKPTDRATLGFLQLHPWTTNNGRLPPVEFCELPTDSPIYQNPTTTTENSDTLPSRGDPCHLKDESLITELKRMGFSDVEIEYAKKTGDPGPVMAAYHLLRAEKKRAAAVWQSNCLPPALPPKSVTATPTTPTASYQLPLYPPPLQVHTTLLQSHLNPLFQNDLIPRTPLSSGLIISIEKSSPTGSPAFFSGVTPVPTSAATAFSPVKTYMLQHGGESNYSTATTTPSRHTPTTASLDGSPTKTRFSTTTTSAAVAPPRATLLAKLRSPTGITPRTEKLGATSPTTTARTSVFTDSGTSFVEARGSISYSCPASTSLRNVQEMLEMKFRENSVDWEESQEGKYICRWETPCLMLHDPAVALSLGLDGMMDALVKGIQFSDAGGEQAEPDDNADSKSKVGASGIEFTLHVIASSGGNEFERLGGVSLKVTGMMPNEDVCEVYVGQFVKSVLAALPSLQ